MFTQICSLRQGLIAYNTITHKIIQLNMPCYCPNNHISLFLIPDWSFRSRWTQKGDLKLRPQSSQICPLKGPYSWMVDWMSIRGMYYCLYEVHWLGSMVFHWYDTHLLKLLHAIWSPSTLKIGEVETKGVKKHICKRRPREEEAECPHNRYNEVKMWMHQALLGWVQGCESCGWKTLRKSHRLREGSSGAHNEPRIHRIESIQTAFLPNLWTEDPSVPFSLQFGSILTSLCGDKVFFFCHWVTTLGYVHSSSCSQ